MLHYKVEGEGPSVILIHGFLESMTMWDDIVPHLLDKYQIVRVDLPGHGKSESKRDTEHMTQMADDVLNVVEHLSIQDFTVIGHSMGGYVAGEIARNDHVSGIMLLNSHSDKDSDTRNRDRTRVLPIIEGHYEMFVRESVPGLFMERSLKEQSARITRIQEEALKFDPHGLAACTRGMRDRKSSLSFLKEFNRQVWFVAGLEDQIMPIEMIRSQCEQVGGELRVIENSAHMSHIEQPERTLQCISEFLSEVSGS